MIGSARYADGAFEWYRAIDSPRPNDRLEAGRSGHAGAPPTGRGGRLGLSL
ncbi:secreted protein [Cutibacterium acnes JCM 18909]|nr:secreted protein [Cutibacterium acnes JCM 18909]